MYEVEHKNLQSSSGKVSGADIAIEGNLMKMDITSGAADWDGEMIFRGDRREMVVVDHKDKSYFVLDEEQMRALGNQVNQAMESMEQALAMLPESQRAQMEKMMKSRMPDVGTPREPSELKKTGETDTVNGYPCVKYIVLRAGVKERELWVTGWDNVDGGADVASLFGEMADFMKEMLDSLPQIGGQKSFGDPTFDHMKEMNGFPVVTREYGDGGAVVSEATLKGSRSVNFSPGDFEPPKNYRHKDMMKSLNR